MIIQENNFYLQRVLRDEYQLPLRSCNYLPEIFSSLIKFSNIHYTISEGVGSLVPNTYTYKIFAQDEFKNLIESEEINASLTLTTSSVGSFEFEWDPIPSAKFYIVYGRSNNFEYYWKVFEPRFVDTGSNVDALPSNSKIPNVTSNNPYILFPEYEIRGKNFISPFIYKYNQFYNYYEGWLFYPELLVNFSNISENNASQNLTTTGKIPSIFISIIYDEIQKLTYIYLKSYQHINEWHFTISIPELGIDKKSMKMIDESTFSYEYSNNEGLIVNPFIITIRGNQAGVDVFTAKTNEIHQRYDLTDLIQIPMFDFNQHRYLVDVPLIEKEKFNQNRTLFLDKILTFLLGFNFEENRMISDNLQFRFLNTDSIRSFLLSNCIVQKYNLFKNLNYLKNQPISIIQNPNKIPLHNESWIIGSDSPIPIASTEIDGEALKIYQEIGYGGLQNAKPYCPDGSPYSIILNGDYTDKVEKNDIVRIKNAITKNINGMYHVLKVEFNGTETIIYILEKIDISANEGELYVAAFYDWRKGGPDNIAQWNTSLNSWQFQTININDVVTICEPSYETYVYNQYQQYVEYMLRLPLKLEIEILTDQQLITQNNIDLDSERLKMQFELAKFLQLQMTGTDIIYYPSSIIEFVIEPRKNWIKGMSVKTFESSESNLELQCGIEALPESKIRDNINESKMEILRYSSIYYWWDVNNIKINYNLTN